MKWLYGAADMEKHAYENCTVVLHTCTLLCSTLCFPRTYTYFIQLPMRSTTESHCTDPLPTRVSAVTDALENTPQCLHQRRTVFW